MRTARRVPVGANATKRDIFEGLGFRTVPNLGTRMTKINFRSVAGIAADDGGVKSANIPKQELTVSGNLVIERSPVRLKVGSGTVMPDNSPDEGDETHEFYAVPGSVLVCNVYAGGKASTYAFAVIFEPA